MLKPWPKLNDKREWIFHSVCTGWSCLIGGIDGKGFMWWIAWIIVTANAFLYLVTLYCDYLDEKWQREYGRRLGKDI